MVRLCSSRASAFSRGTSVPHPEARDADDLSRRCCRKRNHDDSPANRFSCKHLRVPLPAIPGDRCQKSCSKKFSPHRTSAPVAARPASSLPVTHRTPRDASPVSGSNRDIDRGRRDAVGHDLERIIACCEVARNRHAGGDDRAPVATPIDGVILPEASVFVWSKVRQYRTWFLALLVIRTSGINSSPSVNRLHNPRPAKVH